MQDFGDKMNKNVAQEDSNNFEEDSSINNREGEFDDVWLLRKVFSKKLKNYCQ